MRRAGMILLLSGITLITSYAQDKPKDSWPAWTITKDIHRMRFKDVDYAPSPIKTGNSDWAISKGAHRVKADAAPSVNVAMTGYPVWTISKGIARHQAERNSKK